MRMSLRARLGLSYLAVILVGMGLIAPLAWLAVERLYLNTQSANLLAQAQLVAAALRSETVSATGAPAAYTQAANTLPGIHTRLIDAQGGAVIDLGASGQPAEASWVPLPQWAQNAAGQVTAAELLSRPEIAQARQGYPSSAVRRLDTAGGKRVLYAAAPVLAGDGNVTQIVYLASPLPDTQWAALPAAVRWQLAGVVLLAVLLAAASALLLSRSIAGPVHHLASAAQAVSNGDLSQCVPGGTTITELEVLSKAFNDMTASLRQADQAKTAFISDVTHELRTPLTVIKGTIETLQDGAMDDLDGRGPLLSAMSRETERLIRLVNDLLVLTRADAGALNLQIQLLDLAELARSRCAHFAQLARQKQVRLAVAPEPAGSVKDSFAVRADTDRLSQVLDNLLANAIRYSPPGEIVIVALSREVDRVVCRVSDSGPGIPAKYLPMIFDRFFKVDPAREQGIKNQPDSKAAQGSGLGLAIVRSLVLAHGGQVEASSVEGQGTTITFWLPAVD